MLSIIKCRRPRRYAMQIFLIMVLVWAIRNYNLSEPPPETDLDSVRRSVENTLEEQLKLDKGTGCDVPQLDPFSAEATQFDEVLPKVTCPGQDWVECYHSNCRVKKEILRTMRDVSCTYRDIVFETDFKNSFGSPVEVRGADEYRLQNSDFVSVHCVGKHVDSFFLQSKWSGLAAGLRSSPELWTPPGQRSTLNVLVFGFDTTSRSGFTRRMPSSYKMLTEELGAKVLKGYNIVGDGTPAALFPILTGRTELELPDFRKGKHNNRKVDETAFIFHKLKEKGYGNQCSLEYGFDIRHQPIYIPLLDSLFNLPSRAYSVEYALIPFDEYECYRTAFFEHEPSIGTFQYRLNGFRRQPADHYLRSLLLERPVPPEWFWSSKAGKYCLGDTPQYKLMMNLTNQVLRLDGKRFVFTFIVDITHNDNNVMPTADDDFVEFLKVFRKDGRLEDTLLFVIGDHGPRFTKTRATLYGRLEERLPLMAIVLPEQLKRERPSVETALEMNVAALTTPHDIHATILDAVQMKELWNPYKIKGADLTRALTLFEPIPRSRSCSEAGVEPHWCSCLVWAPVSEHEPVYRKTADALVAYINALTMPVRSLCVPRSLKSISSVVRQRVSSRLMSVIETKNDQGFSNYVPAPSETYLVKITVGPGEGQYEATMTYIVKDGRFDIATRDISRTNAYNKEPACISATHPHLNMYCYCGH